MYIPTAAVNQCLKDSEMAPLILLVLYQVLTVSLRKTDRFTASAACCAIASTSRGSAVTASVAATAARGTRRAAFAALSDGVLLLQVLPSVTCLARAAWLENMLVEVEG
jgi:hypothetical protein